MAYESAKDELQRLFTSERIVVLEYKVTGKRFQQVVFLTMSTCSKSRLSTIHISMPWASTASSQKHPTAPSLPRSYLRTSSVSDANLSISYLHHCDVVRRPRTSGADIAAQSQTPETIASTPPVQTHDACKMIRITHPTREVPMPRRSQPRRTGG
jgi:hypothetical protein